MKKRMIIMLLAVTVVLGGLFGFKIFQGMMIKKFMSSMPAPVQTVSTTKAVMSEWQPRIEAVGTLRAVNGADLAAEVSGIVAEVRFESGTNVEKDTPLVELRAEDAIAKLASLEAAAKVAKINFDRDEKLIKTMAISQAVYDADHAALDSANAQVEEQKAIVAKKTIRAPFAGKIGIRAVDVGQYLNPGTAIATLQQLDPIYVDFNVPEQALAQVAVGQKVTALVTAAGGEPFVGEITALNTKVDEGTRNIQIRATFKNADGKILPGMFASVTLDVGKAEKYITLPQSAITYNPYGNTVYVVDGADAAKPVAKQTFITTGLTRGDQVAVLTGLKEGDEVVTSGQIKLRNGAPLAVNNSVQPKSEAAPVVEDR